MFFKKRAALISWKMLQFGEKAFRAPGSSKERDTGLFAVQLHSCQPLALILVNGQKPETGGRNRTEKRLQRATLVSPGGDSSKK
jgi:hypothetical protein